MSPSLFRLTIVCNDCKCVSSHKHEIRVAMCGEKERSMREVVVGDCRSRSKHERSGRRRDPCPLSVLATF
jgi:hypothetical protein